MRCPQDLKYTPEHEWLRIEGEIATIGLTAYAADAMGDVVCLDLPQVGDRLTAGECCGEIESTRAVSDVFAPVDGEVTEVNRGVVTKASLINTAPFAAGWLFRVQITGDQTLLTAADYTALIRSGC